MTEVPFFHDVNEVGRRDGDDAGDRVGAGELPLNSSFAIEQMSEVLRKFSEDFNYQRNYILIAMYVPVIVIAVTANILVIVVVFKNHYMRSVTNYFVVNLSVADLLVTTLCMPMAVSQAVSITWLYGEIMCKLFFYLQGVAVAASVFTITAMSIDRYLAIRSPIDFRRIFNRKSTIMVIVFVWSLSLSIFAPVLKAVKLKNLEQDNMTLALAGDGEEPILHIFKPPSLHICFEDFSSLGIHAHLFGTTCFILVYAIPGFIVIVAYSMMGRTLCARKPPFDCDSIEGSASSQQGFRLVRERRRVAWILLILAILFALCWLPYNVLRLLIDLGLIDHGNLVADILAYCLFLGHANSALNPAVYCFMTRNFRRCVSEILCRNRYGIARKPHRKTLAGSAGARAIFAGGARRRTSVSRGSRRGDVPRSGCLGARATLRRSVTTTTGCDSFDRHSPHRHCYVLRSTTQTAAFSRSTGRKPSSAETRLDGAAAAASSSSARIRSQSLHDLVTSAREHRPRTLNSRGDDDGDGDAGAGRRGDTVHEYPHRHSN